MQALDSLVLEVFKQDSGLKLSVFEQKEHASTLRHYSQVQVSFDEINELSKEAALILNKGSIENLKKTAHLLWNNLLSRSVKDKLKNPRIFDLILSIDEELIDIPWELLYDGSEFLCLKFNLGRVIRTAYENSPFQYRSVPSIPKMLILANPTGDLSAAYLEGLNIRNRFDRQRKRVHISFKSTSIDRMFVKRNICDYDIVHFAGHCEYDLRDPKNSGWVLNDGRFCPSDILKLGESTALPSLIFSNACHSAENPPAANDADYRERNYGLASAFLFSGVRHYIGTIRKIEDPASFSFAKEFYAHLLVGKSVGECVRFARLSLMKEFGIKAIPWASYLLYGDPNFVLFKAQAIPKRFKNLRPPVFSKRILTRLSLALLLASVAVSLYLYLPTVNPGTYVLFSRSEKLFLKGDNQQVISLCQRLIDKDPKFLAAYPLLAETFRRIGKPDEAIKYYFDYSLASAKQGDRKAQAAAYIGIGWTQHLQGEYSKSMEFYNKALNLACQNNDKLNEADVLGKIAIWHMDKDENDKALELLTKSSEINRERQRIYRHRYNLACDYFNLGLLFSNKDDLATARQFYDKSFALFDKMKLTYELSDYYFNVGEIHYHLKEYQRSLDFYQKGLELDQRLGHLASDYIMLGELHMEMERFDEAEGFFNKTISLCKEIKAPLELASAYFDLGLLYKKKGNKGKAREYLRYAQEIYRKVDTPDLEKVTQELLGLNSSS
ncbi:MAG: tetratricopeptide repeat protein [Candidatus Omnitrophica bacterium]|nr:tetratricopeptide repeat protein [Candidatus Omnitrophota bacterium]